MITPVWTEDRKAMARAAAREWAGVKHVNRIAVKGVGIDCVNFVFEVMIAAGLLDRRRFPFYDERLGALRKRNVLEDLLVNHLFAASMAPSMPTEFGDLIVCQCGRQTNHVGMIIDGAFWHVPGRGRVGPESWAVWKPRAQAIVRMTAPGYKVDPGALTWAAIRSTLPSTS